MSSTAPTHAITITQFRPSDLRATTTLFKAYAASLHLDLSFQSFAEELAGLPGKYGPPGGALLLARRRRTTLETSDAGAGAAEECMRNGEAEVLGCVALRPLSEGICEMKRLYVIPAGRGLGVGRALSRAVVAEARERHYSAIRFDTLPHMDAARTLYRELGFVEIAAYYDTPLEGTIFLELDLIGKRG